MTAQESDPSRSHAGIESVLLGISIAALAFGGVLHLAGVDILADTIWAVVTLGGLAGALVLVGVSARAGRLGVDVVAVLALAGTLAVGEFLAGAVITVMLASGRTLEARASARSKRELRALIERAPRVAHRIEDGAIASLSIESVMIGDLLLVKPGEVVPVDGRVEHDVAMLDESALTGEPLPIERGAGDAVRSGGVNAGGPFTFRATTRAADSTYAGIVRLVATADATSAPFVRLADRYAAVFLGAAVGAAALAWDLSGDLVRAVAVLVVATPCPLILAAPVAIVSGLSRAAHRGVIIKGGGVLERLADVEVLLLDKTGTLTVGRPTVLEVVPVGAHTAAEILTVAASLDQVSPHVLATAVVRSARERGLSLSLPDDVVEEQGQGIRGIVAGRTVAVGKAVWVVGGRDPVWARSIRRRADLDAAITVFVAIDGEPAGGILLEDPIRADAARTVRELRRDGIRRAVMVSGDRADVAESVGAVIGLDAVMAERSPPDKVEVVRLERKFGTTIMVGDGINDAPALAAADVGVAMGARGATASSQTADVVLVVDRLARLGEAMQIARRARRIARQSAITGISLSAVAMVVAAAGYLPPTWGAIAQEGIDVAVIVNALRALRGGSRGRLPDADLELTRRFMAEHRTLRPDVDQLRDAADALATAPDASTMALVRSVHEFLRDELGPHEEAEDAELYPMMARVMGGADPTGTMSRAHVEIAHLIRRLGRVLENVDPTRPDDEDVRELRRLLYGLHAVLKLHFAQEDEGYLSLVDEVTDM